MNKIILVGRLTKDPEVRSTSAGFSTANFTVAVNRNFKNKDGNYDADFLPCVAFRNTADFVSKFFKKGSMISLEGRVQTRNYDAQDGSKRYVTEVVVENVEFVGGKIIVEKNTNNGVRRDIYIPPHNDNTKITFTNNGADISKDSVIYVFFKKINEFLKCLL